MPFGYWVSVFMLRVFVWDDICRCAESFRLRWRLVRVLTWCAMRRWIVGGKIPSEGKIRRKCIHNVPAQETAKHRAKFSLTSLSDVAAVTKPRRETGWNLLGWPKLANQSQPLVHRSLPYYEDMWRRYCCLTSFFPIVDTCLSSEDIARQSCAMVPKWRFFVSCISSKPRAAHFRPAF